MPRIHCFGHIHEGWGAQMVEWKAYQHSSEPAERIKSVNNIHVDGANMFENRAVYVDISSAGRTPLRRGEQTLMVNAAIMTERYEPLNGPWLVLLDLPSFQGPAGSTKSRA